MRRQFFRKDNNADKNGRQQEKKKTKYEITDSIKEALARVYKELSRTVEDRTWTLFIQSHQEPDPDSTTCNAQDCTSKEPVSFTAFLIAGSHLLDDGIE